jgi:hypothetical protein
LPAEAEPIWSSSIAKVLLDMPGWTERTIRIVRRQFARAHGIKIDTEDGDAP